MQVSHLFDDTDVKVAVQKAEKRAAERLAALTNAQRAILPLLCDGLLNKQAANALKISQRTIENQRAEIMRRTECKTFADLVRLHMLAG
jgi:two-component system CheB/CheR fusion protein